MIQFILYKNSLAAYGEKHLMGRVREVRPGRGEVGSR